MITNSKCVAEQIKIDKGENVVMDEPKIERIERQKLKDIAMDGVKFGKVGKLENCKFMMRCSAEARRKCASRY